MSDPVRQIAMLVGGMGTRLGELTRETPKPMLPVAGRPFLEHLLLKAHRHGFDRVMLLAGFRSEVMTDYLAQSGIGATLGLTIAVSVEPEPLGTAGALLHAIAGLDPELVMVNGDTWFDFDWRDLAGAGGFDATMALRAIEDADRYETLELDGDTVSAIRPRSATAGAALINGGAYRLRRDALPVTAGFLSLETDVLPRLVAERRLGGRAYAGDFIDIGVPDSYRAAQTLLAAP